jgi:diphthamide synthase (EF-2-diphthine--ammonia ligase)
MNQDLSKEPCVRPKVWVAWSSGKDSAWTLHRLRSEDRVEVTGLLTTVDQTANRVAVHAVRKELLDAQARAVGLLLTRVVIPSPCANVEYERAMRQALSSARKQGVTHIAFGDLFLEDIRQYRETMFAGSGVTPLFPL